MDRQANVTSIDALSAFRSSLVIFITSGGSALDEVRDEARRMRTWLQLDQRAHWQGKLKRLRKQLEQAEAELFTSRLSAMTEHSAAKQMAVTRLRRLVRETEERVKVLKKWIRNYDTLVEPLLKKLDSMQHFVKSDLPKAVAQISQTERLLDDYARTTLESAEDDEKGPPAGQAGAETAGGEEEAGGEEAADGEEGAGVEAGREEGRDS